MAVARPSSEQGGKQHQSCSSSEESSTAGQATSSLAIPRARVVLQPMLINRSQQGHQRTESKRGVSRVLGQDDHSASCAAGTPLDWSRRRGRGACHRMCALWVLCYQTSKKSSAAMPQSLPLAVLGALCIDAHSTRQAPRLQDKQGNMPTRRYSRRASARRCKCT